MNNLTSLQAAVIEQLGYDVEDFGKDEDLASTLEDICNHGIDGGFSGFIYYTDTVEFAKANMELIVEALKSDKDDFGMDSIFSLVAGFSCLNNDYSPEEIAEAIYGDSEDTQILNALAWYSAETVARELELA